MKAELPLTDRETQAYDRIVYISKKKDLFEWVQQVNSSLADPTSKSSSLYSRFMGLFRSAPEPTPEPTSLEALSVLSPEDPPGFDRIVIRSSLRTATFTIVAPDMSFIHHMVLTSTALTSEYRAQKALMHLTMNAGGASLKAYDTSSNEFVGFSSTESRQLIELNYEAYAKVKSVAVRTAPVTYNYHPQITEVFIKFFSVDHTKESLNLATQKNLETTLSVAEAFSTENTLILDIEIAASEFILPVGYGEVKMSTGKLTIRDAENTAEYRRYEVILSDTRCLYCRDPQSEFPVLDRFELRVLFGHLKQKAASAKHASLATFIVEANLNKLALMMSTSVYASLISINKYLGLGVEDDQSFVSEEGSIAEPILETPVMSNHKYQMNFIKSYAKLTKTHIYLYNGPDGPQIYKYRIRSCIIAEVEDVSHCIELDDKRFKFRLSFNDARTARKWASKLTELVSQIEVLIKPRKSQAAEPLAKGDSASFRGSFIMEAVELTITNEDKAAWLQLAVSSIRASTYMSSVHSSVDLTIGSLQALDFIVVEPRFQSLLELHPDMDKLMTVNVTWPDPAAHNYNDGDIQGRAVISGLKVNWNPETLSTLLDFFMVAGGKLEHEVSNSVSMLPYHILMNFTLEVSLIDIYLNIDRSPISLVRCKLNGLSLNAEVKNCGTFVKGGLHGLEVFDLTNYPLTSIVKDFSKVEPFKVLSVSNESQADSQDMVRLSMQMLEFDAPDRVNDIGNLLEVTLESIRIIYLHQPILRLIDYINNKILGLLSAEYRAQHTGQSQLRRISTTMKVSDLVKLAVTQERLNFTSVNIKINRPEVHLYPRPHFPDFIVVGLGDITVTNSQQKTSLRWTEEVWEDVYSITLQHMGLKCRDFELTNSFDLDVKILKPYLFSAQQSIQALDKSIKVEVACPRLNFELLQHHFTLILKLSDLNFNYDDYCAEMQELSGSSEDPPKHDKVTQRESGVFLRFEMKFGRVELKILDRNNLPFAGFRLCLRMLMESFNDASMMMQITGDKFYLQSYVFDKRSRHTVQLCKPLTKNGEPILKVAMLKDPEGDKHLTVTLHRLHLSLELAYLVCIQSFFSYSVPNYSGADETPTDYQAKSRPGSSSTRADKAAQGSSLTIDLIVEKPVISLQPQGSLAVVLQTDVRLHNQWLAKRHMPNKEFPVSVLQVSVPNLEIYVCLKADLVNLVSIDKLPKRRILEQVSVGYLVKEFEGKHFESNVDITICEFTLTYRDAKLLNQAYTEQLARMEETKQLTTTFQADSTPIENYGRLAVQSVVRHEDQFEIPSAESSQIFEVVTRGFDFRVIDDSSLCYSPLLQLTVPTAYFKSEYSPDKDSAVGSFELKVNFFNPNAACYEPLIEPVKVLMAVLHVDAELYERPTPHEEHIQEAEFAMKDEVLVTGRHRDQEKSTMIFISKETPINIAVSEVMLVLLFKTLKKWKAGLADAKQLNLGSPVYVRNLTGYPIEIKSPEIESPEIESFELGLDKKVPIAMQTNSLRHLDLDKVSFNMNFLSPHPFTSVNGVKVNYSGVVVRNVYNTRRQEHQVFFVVSSEKTRRVLTVSSPLILHNKTDLTLAFRFQDTNASVASETTLPVHKLIISPGRRAGVPFDYTSTVFEFKPQEEGAVWVCLNALECMATHEFRRSIQSGRIHFVLELKADQQVHTLTWLPTAMLTNGLPCSAYVEVKDKEGDFEEKMTLDYAQKRCLYLPHTCSPRLLLRLPPNLSSGWSRFFNYTERKLQLKDTEGGELSLRVDARVSSNKEFTLYAPIVILNHSGLSLSFTYSKYGRTHKVPGKTGEVLMCRNISSLRAHHGRASSKPFSVKTVGASNVIEIEDKSSQPRLRHEVVYSVEFGWLNSESFMFSRLVRFSPHYVIVNSSSYPLAIKQFECPDEIILRPEKRCPFHWSNPDLAQLMSVVIADKAPCDWSMPFSIENVGSISIKLCRSQGECMVMRVDVSLSSATVFIDFSDESESKCSYLIENFSKVLVVSARQSHTLDSPIWIEQSSSTPFGWLNSLVKSRQVTLDLYAADRASGSIAFLQSVPINFDYLSSPDSIHLKQTRVCGIQVHIYTYNNGTARVLRIDHSEAITKKEEAVSSVCLEIPEISVSFIENEAELKGEVLNLTLKDLTLLLKLGSLTQELHLQVKKMQLDNQADLLAIFPSVMHCDKELNREVLDVHLKRKFDKNWQLHSFEMLMQNIWLNVEYSFIQKMIEVALRINLALKLTSSNQSEVFRTKSPAMEWDIHKIELPELAYQIAMLKLHPVRLTVSFMPVGKDDAKESITAALSSVGKLLALVDKAPIRFNAITLENIISPTLLSSLSKHYKSQLQRQIFTLIGHSDALGNPIGLLGNLGQGVTDLFYEPANAIIYGPLSAGKGLFKGAGSLLKRTVQSSFGSVSRATGCVSNGLSVLTRDQGFITSRHRRKVREIPLDFIEGIGIGLKTFGSNCVSGAVGVIEKPTQEGKRAGFLGGLKGSLIGLSGLLVKPVTGLLDAISIAAEGVKNSTTMNVSLTQTRLRMPRILYGTSQKVMNYSEADVHVFYYMCKLNKQFKDKLFEYQIYRNTQTHEQFLFVAYSSVLVLVNVKRTKVVWTVQTKYISEVSLEDECVVIRSLKERTQGQYDSSEQRFKFEKEEDNSAVVAQLKVMQDDHKLVKSTTLELL
jgi:hypothetical protein